MDKKSTDGRAFVPNTVPSERLTSLGDLFPSLVIVKKSSYSHYIIGRVRKGDGISHDHANTHRCSAEDRETGETEPFSINMSSNIQSPSGPIRPG